VVIVEEFDNAFAVFSKLVYFLERVVNREGWRILARLGCFGGRDNVIYKKVKLVRVAALEVARMKTGLKQSPYLLVRGRVVGHGARKVSILVRLNHTLQVRRNPIYSMTLRPRRE
jgi:hypothetical protein